MNGELDRVDAITLRAWRWTNAIGWPLLAVALAWGVHLAVDAIVSIRLNASGISDLTFSPSAFTFGCNVPPMPGELCFDPIPNTVVKFVIRATLSAVIGLLIGFAVAPRALRRPPRAAALAAAAYALIAIALVEWYPDGAVRHIVRPGIHGPSPVQTLLYEATIAATVAVAWWTGRVVERRRPAG